MKYLFLFLFLLLAVSCSTKRSLPNSVTYIKEDTATFRPLTNEEETYYKNELKKLKNTSTDSPPSLNVEGCKIFLSHKGNAIHQIGSKIGGGDSYMILDEGGRNIFYGNMPVNSYKVFFLKKEDCEKELYIARSHKGNIYAYSISPQESDIFIESVIDESFLLLGGGVAVPTSHGVFNISFNKNLNKSGKILRDRCYNYFFSPRVCSKGIFKEKMLNLIQAGVHHD